MTTSWHWPQWVWVVYLGMQVAGFIVHAEAYDDKLHRTLYLTTSVCISAGLMYVLHAGGFW